MTVRDGDLGHRRGLADDLEVEVALGPEVVVEQPAGDPCLTRDLGGRHFAIRALGKEALRDDEDLLAPLVGGEASPPGLLGGGHDRESSTHGSHSGMPVAMVVVKTGGRFSRNDITPSIASLLVGSPAMRRESISCAG